MKKYFDILQKCRLFDNIEDENLIVMLDCLGAKVVSYCKKEIIMEEGEPAKYIGIILSGRAQLIRVDYYGNGSIIANIEASHLFGESFACAGAEAVPVSVMAAEDTEIMLIDCQRIISACTNACEFHKQMIFNLLKVIATKNIILNQKLEVTAKRTTREKLMTYLLFQAKKNRSNAFTIPYDRQELADYLEVDRSGLSAEISKLRDEGIIECKRSWFRII